MRLTHVINPVNAPRESGLGKAQAMAFASIARAIEYTARFRPDVEIELVAATHEADRPAIPPGVAAVGVLTRSLLDATDIRPAKPLPLIGDIYRVALERGTGSHVIYSNADIGLQPFFYELAAELLVDRPAFSITRRNIDKTLIEPGFMTRAMAAAGEAFGGVDVFVCPRADIESFDLHASVIGLPTVEYGLLAAIDAACGFRSVIHFDLHAVFHHGNDRVWKAARALGDFNDAQQFRIMRSLLSRHAAYPTGSVFDYFRAKILQRHAKNTGLWRRMQDRLGGRKIARPAPWQDETGRI